MPTIRRALARQRHPSFSAETLQLFLELERIPLRRRGDEFREKSKQLARLLNLTAEWWVGENVLSHATQPCKPPEFAAHDAFFRCRAVRLMLLDALKRERVDAPRAEERPTATGAEQ